MLSTESLPEPPFKITNEDLQEICNFDKRADPAHVEFLNDPLVGGIEGLAALLKTDPQNGLALKTPYHIPEAMKGSKSGKAVRVKIRDSRCEDEYDRREIFGENIIPPAPSETILQIIVGTVMEDPILKILIVGAFVVLTLGTILCPAEGWTEGLAIVIAVFIVLGVTAGNDWSKDRKFKKLLLLQTDKKCRTTRGGVKFELSSWDIYVGDLIELVVGDEVPADGIFVQGNGLVIDESPLTGETVPVKKNSNAPFIFSGCQVAEGSGFMIVTAVGMNSSGGKIQELLNEAQNEMTPLQEKLKEVAILIGKIGVAAGIITFLALGIRWAVDFVARKPLEHAVCSTSGISGGNDTISRIVLLVEHFVVAITVVVVAVPEGLPLAVTLALSLSMFKMMRDKCFVRHLDASETMGQATTICTDKTGTLTYNRMSVVRLMIKDRIFKGEGSGDKDAMPFSPKTLPPNILQLITENCCLNSNCFIKNEDQVNEAAAVPIFVGSATEGAILIMSKKFGVKYTQLRERIKVIPNGVWSFSADRKRMSVCIHDSTANKYRLYTKGASEIILKLCPKIYDPITGGTAEMSESDRAAVEKNIRSWASDGLRTLCLAYRDFDTIIDTSNPDAETSLVFLCLLAIKDPLRKEIPAAVATCQRAGIIVRMVTGDNILTATKIAKEANIFFGDGIAVEGPVFRSMSKAQQIATLPMLQVMARCSPSDKFDLVSLLQEVGEVVAVTGDGTNDAPALKQADIGFSMGVCGTQVAMNASDIVLLDDNFASIVSATRWGRNVLCTIRKFLQFQLGINIASILITFAGSVVVGKAPLTTIQLLLVNLVMDSLGALALASDNPDNDILLDPPQRRTDSIMTASMWEYIAVQTVYQTLSALMILFGVDAWIPIDTVFHTNPEDYAQYPSVRASTMVFAAFIMTQVTNLICARSLGRELNLFARFFTNRLFLGILFVILVIIVLSVTVAYKAFKCTPLNGVEWVTCIVIALCNIPVVFFYRLASKLYHASKKTNGKSEGVNGGKIEPEIPMEKPYTIPRNPSILKTRGDIEDELRTRASVTKRQSTGPVQRDIERGLSSNRHGSSSSIVEVFRKIKVDKPMPMKSDSQSSLRK